MAYDEVCPPNPKGTIMLLTGLGSKRLAWYRQMEEFGRQYRTIALDHRDVGDSDPFPGSYTIADQARDVVSVMKALGIQKAHIVGISMGGFISLELAIRYAQVVDKLVLVSTSAGGLTNVPPGPRMMLGLFRREQGEVGELARKVYGRIMAPGYMERQAEDREKIMAIARYRPMSPDAYQRQLRACLSHNAAFRLNQIQAPTLVIHGDKDPLVPTANGRRLARKIRGARLIIYPHTGHIPIIEQAAQFNRDVLAFLAG